MTKLTPGAVGESASTASGDRKLRIKRSVNVAQCQERLQLPRRARVALALQYLKLPLAVLAQRTDRRAHLRAARLSLRKHVEQPYHVIIHLHWYNFHNTLPASLIIYTKISNSIQL